MKESKMATVDGVSATLSCDDILCEILSRLPPRNLLSVQSLWQRGGFTSFAALPSVPITCLVGNLVTSLTLQMAFFFVAATQGHILFGIPSLNNSAGSLFLEYSLKICTWHSLLTTILETLCVASGYCDQWCGSLHLEAVHYSGRASSTMWDFNRVVPYFRPAWPHISHKVVSS
ncbi:hypothetical protein Tsubulata_015621 [Turnera subulata]|uniref:F-box domain-containing protein n=1 Tax=Turnera subulata TaxID=218843 RepID=A0A9Q0JL12_9ROSI|nr:hypothetical protein Tsubulata_015621 [Turnera subulata]